MKELQSLQTFRETAKKSLQIIEKQVDLEANRNQESQDLHPTMVAIMVVGQSRILLRRITKARMTREFTSRALQILEKRGISTVFSSHLIHVLQPLQQQGFMPEYLLCVDRRESQMPPEVTQAWIFPAENQLRRMKACLRKVLEREALLNYSYSFFIRLRPDFLVLTHIPNLQTSDLSKGCVLTRLRAAVNIAGLTNDHLSYCYCGKSCCSKNVLKGTGAGFIVDDMLAIAARDLFMLLWNSHSRKRSSPKSWPLMSPMAETGLTTSMMQKGVPVCPLAIRGLPLGSSNNGHATDAAKCGYVEGDPPLPQTSCGSEQIRTHQVHLLIGHAKTSVPSCAVNCCSLRVSDLFGMRGCARKRVSPQCEAFSVPVDHSECLGCRFEDQSPAEEA